MRITNFGKEGIEYKLGTHYVSYIERFTNISSAYGFGNKL